MQEAEQNKDTEMGLETDMVTDTMGTKSPVEQIPDGKIERKIGNTTYVVNVFFDHDSGFTAEDKIKRLILAGQ